VICQDFGVIAKIEERDIFAPSDYEKINCEHELTEFRLYGDNEAIDSIHEHDHEVD
jgi:hypothetical protein